MSQKPTPQDLDIFCLYAAEGEIDGVASFIKEYKDSIDHRSSNGLTAIVCAIHAGQRDVVELLLDNGVAVDTLDFQDRTPLMHAAGGGYLDIAQLLIDRGSNVNARDMVGKTPLILAVQHQRKDVTLLLLDHGATSDTPDSTGWSAQKWAQLWSPEIQELLKNWPYIQKQRQTEQRQQKQLQEQQETADHLKKLKTLRPGGPSLKKKSSPKL